MNVTVLIPAPFEPVTLAEVYGALRLDAEGSPATHVDDAQLTRHIASARAEVELMTRRSLVRQTLRLSLGGFPLRDGEWRALSALGRMGAVRRILLVRPPITNVLAVEYYDASNVLQTLDPAAYYWTDERVPELRFVTGFVAPGVYERPDAVRVTVEAGYAPVGSPPATQEDYAANVPEALKDAVLLGVQLRYDDLMPADRASVTHAMESLVQPYRIQLVP